MQQHIRKFHDKNNKSMPRTSHRQYQTKTSIKISCHSRFEKNNKIIKEKIIQLKIRKCFPDDHHQIKPVIQNIKKRTIHTKYSNNEESENNSY